MYQGLKGITGLEVSQNRCQDVALFGRGLCQRMNMFLTIEGL